jgi:hypothetical protein
MSEEFERNTYMIERLGTGKGRVGNLRSKEAVKVALKENVESDEAWGIYYRDWTGSETLEAIYAERRWFNG